MTAGRPDLLGFRDGRLLFFFYLLSFLFLGLGLGVVGCDWLNP